MLKKFFKIVLFIAESKENDKMEHCDVKLTNATEKKIVQFKMA